MGEVSFRTLRADAAALGTQTFAAEAVMPVEIGLPGEQLACKGTASLVLLQQRCQSLLRVNPIKLNSIKDLRAQIRRRSACRSNSAGTKVVTDRIFT
jgi:hypothetical protein